MPVKIRGRERTAIILGHVTQHPFVDPCFRAVHYIARGYNTAPKKKNNNKRESSVNQAGRAKPIIYRNSLLPLLLHPNLPQFVSQNQKKPAKQSKAKKTTAHNMTGPADFIHESGVRCGVPLRRARFFEPVARACYLAC